MSVRVHIIIPRVDPEAVGLSDLYRKIVATDPDKGQARHLLDQDLALMHAHWFVALCKLQTLGSVEWTVSRSALDLPARHRSQIQSAPPALT